MSVSIESEMKTSSFQEFFIFMDNLTKTSSRYFKRSVVIKK